MDLIKSSTRRLKMVAVADTLVQQWLTTGFESGRIKIEAGIPENSLIVGGQLQYDFGGVVLMLFVESPDFPPIPEGGPIPRLNITVKRLDPAVYAAPSDPLP